MPRHLAAALLLALPACTPAALDDIRPARIRVGWSVALPVVAAPGVMPRDKHVRSVCKIAQVGKSPVEAP